MTGAVENSYLVQDQVDVYLSESAWYMWVGRKESGSNVRSREMIISPDLSAKPKGGGTEFGLQTFSGKEKFKIVFCENFTLYILNYSLT